MSCRKALAGGALAGSALMAYAVRSPRSGIFGPSVFRGDPDRRAIALTFDDGPSEGTPRLLDLLDRHGVPATFFQCGANVERLPEVARAVRSAGHEIGNHSHTHPLLCFHSARSIEREFRRAQQTIVESTGFTPALMRAPYGARWFGFRRMQHRLGLLGVMWTVIGYDWSLASVSIASRVAGSTGNGSIVCLHDGRALQVRPDIGETMKAVELLIPELRERGFRFETVTQLLCPKN